MYEIDEEVVEEERIKWLEAERDLALMGIGLQSGSPNYGPIVDEDIEGVDKFGSKRNPVNYQPRC